MSRHSVGLCGAIALAATIFLTSALDAQVTQASSQASLQNLTCSPTPCVLPNVRLFAYGQGGEYPDEVAVNPGNSSQMVVAAEDGNCGLEGIFSTSDGGATWPTHSCIGTPNAVGEPIVGYDLNGIAYGGGIDDWTAITLRLSTDNGAHWSNAEAVDVDGLGVYFPWLALDTSPISQFKNRLYISSIHGGVYSTGTRVHVSFSGDGGQHWAGRNLDPWQYPQADVYPHISLGSDGTAYATWLRCRFDGPNHDCGETTVPILFSRSTDGGNTWSAPAIIAHSTLAPTFGCAYGYGCLPNTVAEVTNIPVSAVFGVGPTAKVYVVFYNWTGTLMQVEVATSNDGGSTFGAPVRVSSSNVGDQFFPWVAMSQDGTLGVTWLDRRNDPANTKYQPFFATSKDGLTFSPSRLLSTVLSDPGLSFAYLGEDRPHVWVGNTIYSFWMDTRSGQARIELGGVQF